MFIQLTVNTLAGTDLVFPLSRHNLGIGTGNVDSGVHAGFVVSLYDITAEDFAGTHTAIVRTLRSRETTLGPAIWPTVWAEKRVLLLKTEPELVLRVSLQKPSGLVAVVEFVGRSIWVPALGHDKDVVTSTDWVREDGHGADVDVGVVSWSLVG